MEGCILAAYAGLLIGCTIQGNSVSIMLGTNAITISCFVGEAANTSCYQNVATSAVVTSYRYNIPTDI